MASTEYLTFVELIWFGTISSTEMMLLCKKHWGQI